MNDPAWVGATFAPLEANTSAGYPLHISAGLHYKVSALIYNGNLNGGTPGGPYSQVMIDGTAYDVKLDLHTFENTGSSFYPVYNLNCSGSASNIHLVSYNLGTATTADIAPACYTSTNWCLGDLCGPTSQSQQPTPYYTFSNPTAYNGGWVFKSPSGVPDGFMSSSIMSGGIPDSICGF